MLKLTRILVPVDFSEASRLALDDAASLASRFDAHIDLLHVWDLPALVNPQEVAATAGLPASILESISHNASDALERFTAAARAKGISIHAAQSKAGASTYRTIVDEAERGRYDLIVIGTHGRTGLGHVVLGSVAERVVRHAPCPVLVARAQPDANKQTTVSA